MPFEDWDERPTACGKCGGPFFWYSVGKADAAILRARLSQRRVVWCRWADCLKQLQYFTVNLPETCAFCRRSARWCTEVPTAATIVPVDPIVPDGPDPLTPWDLNWADAYVLRGLGIDPETSA